jgi:fatty acid desaturase
MWLGIILLSSTIYGVMAVNGGHHHNKVFHDGDELISMDFGIYQLAATFDRTDSLDNHLFMLTTFGQHVLHHMFPTFDHAILPQLREILFETCKEFEADLCIYPWYQLLIGQFKQLTRTKIRKCKN